MFLLFLQTPTYRWHPDFSEPPSQPDFSTPAEDASNARQLRDRYQQIQQTYFLERRTFL